MKPPLQDGESIKAGTVAVTETQPSSNEAVQVPTQTSGALVVSETPEMSPAESEEEEADEMVEALEELILEAYNNMQIDGEYIFLPDEVAEKLHRVAEQVR
ncbi:hypothetical protein P3T76_000624 [Phytophthora citrophthora]|uniref:Uncharacterized protein n=1 Tax=Phytophthora citrophthora TaxID=4793 RepID=A0AAD9H0Z7_9STRA|nr:hypothetical protein P3T76_000624 [Phytophthora citrophthora]